MSHIDNTLTKLTSDPWKMRIIFTLTLLLILFVIGTGAAEASGYHCPGIGHDPDEPVCIDPT